MLDLEILSKFLHICLQVSTLTAPYFNNVSFFTLRNLIFDSFE